MTANKPIWLSLGVFITILGSCTDSGDVDRDKGCPSDARNKFLKDINITESTAIRKNDVFSGISRAGMTYEPTNDRSTPGCNIEARANKSFFQVYRSGGSGGAYYKIALDSSGELIYVGIVHQNTST